MRFQLVLLSCVVCLSVRPSHAQPPAEPQPPPPSTPAPANAPVTSIADRLKSVQGKFELLAGNHLRYSGGVEQDLGNQTTLSADQVDIYLDTDLLVATGNVVFATPEGRLAAERVTYNLKEGTGRFESASGIMALGEHADRRQFANQEADVYFVGETIEKLAARRYKITNGGFTTCVQPTPRWEFTSGTFTLNLNDYATARHSVLRVKGVPVFYLPIIYYPIKDDDRATGFLLPTYGSSTVRGQAISNAFFWAVDRSQDLTLFHDYFTKSGQGAGTEYRYVAGPQSSGNFKVYRFNRHETTFTDDDQTQTLPASTSFEVSGTMTHAISPTIRARARLDYFTDIVSQQLYHQNIYSASRHSRIIEAGLTASLGRISTSLLYQRNELFNSSTSTQLYGSTPRVTASLAPQRLFRAPVYASVNTEYAYLPYQTIDDGVVVRDSGYGRFDAMPTVRVPLSRLTFLSANTSASYRVTHYSRSADATTTATIDDPYLRQYMTLRSEVVGPVFTRIFDLEGRFVERMKHVIEPAFTVDFTSEIDSYSRTPVTSDLTDFVVSGATRFTYGVTNRVFARTRAVEGVRASTREIMTVGVQQTYYSNPQSGGYDSSYQSTYRQLVDLSPVTVTARVSPAVAYDTNMRIEYDVTRGRGLQMLSLGGNLNMATTSVGANYSHSSIDPRSPNNFVSGSTSLRWLDGRATGSYNVGWDIERGYIVNQNVVVSYLAQCCGLQVEFQKFNYAQLGANIAIPSDTRFNLAITLAGLTTFSNFFGAFGGNQP